jgi:hydroxymethylpyrimidine/phosphomethylpyrimidine kinase
LKKKKCPLVVDPVMVSTSGARLLEPRAIKILKEKLLPLATLVTPNLTKRKV